MPNLFSNCERGFNRQLAAAYITYMMVGSLFEKSTCKNKSEATHLSLHYKEMPQNKQEAQENTILELATHQLGPDYLELLSGLQCEVTFKRQKNNYVILFETGLEGVIAVIDERGTCHIQARIEEE